MESFTDTADVLPERISDVGSARLAVSWVYPAQRQVELVVMPEGDQPADETEDDSQVLRLTAGDTFPIGTETWQLAELEWRTVVDWRVRVRRLADPAGAAPAPRIDVRDAVPVAVEPAGSLDENAVAGLERRLGRPLPVRYRRWLAGTNGARPAGLAQVYGHAFLLYPERPLLGVHPDDPTSDLERADELRRAWLTDDYVVIARPDGGLLAVQVTGWDPDSVWWLPEAAMNDAAGYAAAGYSSVPEYLSDRALRLVARDIHDLLARMEAVQVPA